MRSTCIHDTNIHTITTTIIIISITLTLNVNHCSLQFRKNALFTERSMMSLSLYTIRRYFLKIVCNSLVNISNRHKFLSNICGDSNILRTKQEKFASYKNLMGIALQDKKLYVSTHILLY